jgi:ABC-type multidrug transport system fused ATPase/permease subunit
LQNKTNADGGRNQIASQTDISNAADSRDGGLSAGASTTAVLARYLRPQGARLATLAAFLLASIATQLVSPLIVRRFIDTATHGGHHVALAVLWVLAGIFIGAAIVTQLLQIGATYFSEQLAWAATNALRRDLASHTLGLDMSFHTATSPGDIIERVDGDVAALANFFSQFVLQIIGGALLLVGIFVVLMLSDWRIGSALGAVAIVAGLTMHAMRNVARAQWERVRNAFSGFSAFLEERIAGLEDIRANGGGAHAMRRFAALNRELAVSNMAATRRGQWIYLVASGLFSLGFAIALAVGARLYLLHAVTIGAVFMFMQYAGMMAQPIVLIGLQLQQFQTASASLSRIRRLLAIEPKLKDGPGLDWGASRRFAPKVAFEHVSFAYRADAPVLRDVSLTLEPGTVLGLLGRTGSGKTTLSRLLFRLYDPTEGRIALDGLDIRDATLPELRGRIGLVTQEVQLFDASVRDNATLFDATVADARIVEVLTDLGLGDWLTRQPLGLDTVLVAGGGLSAGEGQLLAFARVFLKDPGLLVLDEASSRLDPVSDRLIERALDKLLGGRAGGGRRTAIIIAHKLSTVARADRICILEHGRVLEAAEREALVADPNSVFSRLLATGVEEALA